jgi:sialate O-acetylesterase
MIQHWVPNSTLNAQACLNSSGGAYAPSQNQRWDIDSGALFNGMIRPWLQFTIKGALWYQGIPSSSHPAGSFDRLEPRDGTLRDW